MGRQVATILAVFGLMACASAGGAQAPKQRGADGAGRAGRDAGGAAEAVVIAPEVLEGWSFLYRFITEVEFVLCLEGRQDNGVLYIDGFRLARMEEASISSVRYQPCQGPRYVGTAHNHPPVEGAGNLCYRSIPDRQSFDLDPRAIIDVVLCGEDKHLWVLKDGRTGGRGLEPE